MKYKIAKVDLRFKRYLYIQINWKARIISINVARGPCNVVKGNKNRSTIRMLFLEGFQPVLMAGLHFLAGLNLNSNLCVSDNGVDFLVIVCVPIGDFLTATVIKLAD